MGPFPHYLAKQVKCSMLLARTSMFMVEVHSTIIQVATWTCGPQTPVQGLILDLARAYKPHYSATSIYHYHFVYHEHCLQQQRHDLFLRKRYSSRTYMISSLTNRELFTLLFTAVRLKLTSYSSSQWIEFLKLSAEHLM